MNDASSHRPAASKRILMLGATGTIGVATVRAFLERGHEVVCFVRSLESLKRPGREWLMEATDIRTGKFSDAQTFSKECIRGESFDALVSCMASRTGAPRDAWAVDHQAHAIALTAAKEAGITHMVLLSAICVQKPRLAFQHAKLAFEETLAESGLTYSIVRPTAYFKSLSGQIDRLKRGRPFLMFGNGKLTACKPISDHDLAHYLADCLENPQLHNRILPIGGPGQAITPKRQGEELFSLLNRRKRFRRVPLALLDIIAGSLRLAGRVFPPMAEKAELARIARYYATESMLVLDPQTGLYDEAATPETGTQTLFDYYAERINGEANDDRADHAIF